MKGQTDLITCEDNRCAKMVKTDRVVKYAAHIIEYSIGVEALKND